MAKTSVFINAWVGAGNLGDELLFERLLSRLAAVDVSDVTTVSLDPAQTESRFPVKALSHRDLLGSIREIRRSRLLILGPGGILQDDTSPWSLPYQLHRVMIARASRVPVIGIGLGAGPIRRRSSRVMLRRALAKSGPLAVRDRDSADLLAGMGLSQAMPTADLVVGSPSPNVEPENRIVVCLRPHRRGGGRLPVTMQKDTYQTAYLETMADALDRVSVTFDTRCHFVAFEPHRDLPLHQRVAALMKSPTSQCVPEPDTILSEVARSRAVIATRFHSGIAALLAQRPAVMIGYAPKVISLASRLDPAFACIANEPGAFASIEDELSRVLEAPPAILTDQLHEMRVAENQHHELLLRALGDS